ncbi:hypothetical protein ACS0TY_015983 [Phlomoides rotata]
MDLFPSDHFEVDNGDSEEPKITPEQAVRLCDRNFGIGADGVIFALPGINGTDYTMQIFNSDGSEPGKFFEVYSFLIWCCSFTVHIGAGLIVSEIQEDRKNLFKSSPRITLKCVCGSVGQVQCNTSKWKGRLRKTTFVHDLSNYRGRRLDDFICFVGRRFRNEAGTMPTAAVEEDEDGGDDAPPMVKKMKMAVEALSLSVEVLSFSAATAEDSQIGSPKSRENCDSDLKSAFAEFLEIRGFTVSNFGFLSDYITARKKLQRVSNLKGLKKYFEEKYM